MGQCKYKSGDYTCTEEALRNSEEGFCIFHEPGKYKDRGKFKRKIEEKIANRDFDFTGYFFPEDISFKKTFNV